MGERSREKNLSSTIWDFSWFEVGCKLAENELEVPCELAGIEIESGYKLAGVEIEVG